MPIPTRSPHQNLKPQNKIFYPSYSSFSEWTLRSRNVDNVSWAKKEVPRKDEKQSHLFISLCELSFALFREASLSSPLCGHFFDEKSAGIFWHGQFKFLLKSKNSLKKTSLIELKIQSTKFWYVFDQSRANGST